MTLLENMVEKLIETPDEGEDDKKGTLHYKGYSFLFRTMDEVSDEIKEKFPKYSSKLCNFGSTRDLQKQLMSGDTEYIRMTLDLGTYDDIYLASTIKTLVPELEFGGSEIFFRVFILVKTPTNLVFPVNLYFYYKSNLSIGGWRINLAEVLGHEFTKRMKKKHGISFSNPFDMDSKELDILAENLEKALLEFVFPSNFKGKLYSEYGIQLMGVKKGDPFVEEIKEPEDKRLPISILYNQKSWEYKEEMSKIIDKHLKDDDDSSKIRKKYGDYLRYVINNRCYEELVTYAKEQNDRICFQVLGVNLMVKGAKMTDDLKELILENSRWEDEKHLYKNDRLRKIRKTYLSEFRKNIKDYQEGNPVDYAIYEGDYELGDKSKVKFWDKNEVDLKDSDLKVLEDLEALTGKKFLEVENIAYATRGFTVKNQRITGLGLYFCFLKKFPESIGNLTSLKELWAHRNNLQYLPKSIDNLKSLEILNLSYNNLKTLSEPIGELISLKELYLSDNDFTTLPESIGNLKSLKILKLYNNNLKTLPDSFKRLRERGVRIYGKLPQ